MSLPSPPFHTTIEELLYNIYLKLQVGGSSGGLSANDIDTLAKLNAILTDSDLMSSQSITDLINDLKGNVPASGDTLEKLYNLIAGLNFLTQQDIDTIAELNAIINDADVSRTSDIDALLDNVPSEGNTLNKLYNFIRGILDNENTDPSPPSLFLDFDVPVVNLSFGNFNNGGGLGTSPGFSNFGVDTVQNCFGVMRFSTGTSTAGGSFLYSVFPNIVLGLGYKIDLTGRLALENLSDDTESYLVYYGFGSVPAFNLNPTNGVFFRYHHLSNGGRWEAVCRNGGIETAIDTGLIAEVINYHIFHIRINPEGTLAEFFIDDMTTPVASIVDNIPVDPLPLLFFSKIEKVAGATARNLYLDYVKYVPSRTMPR